METVEAYCHAVSESISNFIKQSGNRKETSPGVLQQLSRLHFLRYRVRYIAAVLSEYTDIVLKFIVTSVYSMFTSSFQLLPPQTLLCAIPLLGCLHAIARVSRLINRFQLCFSWALKDVQVTFLAASSCSSKFHLCDMEEFETYYKLLLQNSANKINKFWFV
jgi:hypothetical protein